MARSSITPESLAKSGTEHGAQAAVFCWANDYRPNYPRLRWMFAIPNGGLRDKVTASRLKAEGVKSGVPDIFLPVPYLNYGKSWMVKTYFGLFIEMKKVTGGVLSDNQDDYHDYLRKAGYKVVVCFTWEQARDEILEYIKHT